MNIAFFSLIFFILNCTFLQNKNILYSNDTNRFRVYQRWNKIITLLYIKRLKHVVRACNKRNREKETSVSLCRIFTIIFYLSNRNCEGFEENEKRNQRPRWCLEIKWIFFPRFSVASLLKWYIRRKCNIHQIYYYICSVYTHTFCVLIRVVFNIIWPIRDGFVLDFQHRARDNIIH